MQKIVWAVNQVRKRAGLPGVDSQLGNQERMRTIIREERRHEFVGEHKRYFDILRWKTAEVVLNQPGYGINKDEHTAIGDYTQEKSLGRNAHSIRKNIICGRFLSQQEIKILI